MDGLFTFVYRAVFDEFEEFSYDRRLVIIGQCQIRPLPVAENTEPFEFFLLHGDKSGCIFPAKLPLFEDADLIFFVSHVPVNLQLYWKAVTVPARDIGSVKTLHRFIFNDDIFENFVQCMADMDIAVGVGRAVVKYIALISRIFLLNLPVDSYLFPEMQQLRLSQAEVGLHGKAGLW